MRERNFHMGAQEREALLTALRAALQRCSGISFAYVHGSFLSAPQFRDGETGT
jgi:hypothetical protein